MSGTRRIVHVVTNPGGMGGAEKVLVALAEAAERKGWHSTSLNPVDADPKGSDLARALSLQSYSAKAYRNNDLRQARRWCRARLDELQPDIVHAHLAHASLLVATMRMPGIKLLSHQHGDYFHVHRMRIRGAVDRWATRRFDHVVAVSNHVRRFLEGKYGIDPSRITTIPNGWQGQPIPREPVARPTVIAVSNLRQGKGHEVLIDAFATVVSHIEDAELVIVGDGPLRSQIEMHAREVLPESSVRFEGRTEDVWPFLARAHVLVLPSFTETAGIAAMEAMAAGLPVVASDVGGLPELIEHERTGLLVPPGDREALARALIRVLSSPDGCVGWGEAGRIAAEPFGAAEMVDVHYELYERLLKSARM